MVLYSEMLELAVEPQIIQSRCRIPISQVSNALATVQYKAKLIDRGIEVVGMEGMREMHRCTILMY